MMTLVPITAFVRTSLNTLRRLSATLSWRNPACDLIGRPRQPMRFAAPRVFLSSLLALVPCATMQAQTLVATVPIGPHPVAVAVNQTTNMVYVADIDNDNVTVIDGTTNIPTTIPTGGTNGLEDLALNATTNMVYALNGGVFSGGNGDVIVIDGATNTITTTVALSGIGAHIAVNPVTNQIYVCTNAPAGDVGGSLVVIDGSTNAITDTISLPEGSSSVAVDSTRNLIYLIHIKEPGNGTLEVIDGSTNTVKASVTVGYNDSAFVLDTTSNMIYVPDAQGNQMYIIDGSTDTATTAPLEASVGFGTAVNSVTNTVYVPGFVNSAEVVEVFSASTNTVTATVSDPSSGILLANSTTNKIWQFSSPVVIIDGATNAATTVSGTGSGTQVFAGALNPTTNYAYVAQANSLLVINGAATGPAFSASPSPVAFGSQAQGSTSSAMTLTITNSGTASLSISNVAEGGTDAADFPVSSDGCNGATVAAGSTCTLSIKFSPSTAGAESAALTFTDNASDSPEMVSLTGTGTAPTATASTTTLSASATSIAIGTSVTFTATVTPASGTPTPTGTVTFKDGTTTLGTGMLNSSGAATYSSSALAIGSHSITASYGGDSRNLASVSSVVAVSVAQSSTTTVLTSSATSLVVGASATFTATVTGSAGGTTPTGTVTFNDGTTALGTGTLNAGIATYSTSALAAGSHSITAVYAGDTSNAGSTSAAMAISVWPGPPDFTLALSSSSGTFKAGSPITVTITLTSVNGFNASSTLSCGSLPKNTKCVFSSSSITPGTSGTATSTLTIDTDVSTSSSVVNPVAKGSPGPKSGHPLELAGTAGLLLLLPLVAGRSRRMRRLLLAVCGFACLGLLTTTGVTGCGGGPTTPKGTYSVQVTATAGSTTHTATFSLTVD